MGVRGFAEEEKTPKSTFEDDYRRAQELYDKGQFQEATALFQRALQELDDRGRSDDETESPSSSASSRPSSGRSRQSYD